MPSSCMRRFSSWWPPACRSGGGSSKGPFRGTPSAGSTPSSGLFSPHTQSSCGGDCSTKNRDRSGDPESDAARHLTVRHLNSHETRRRSSPSTTGISQTSMPVTSRGGTDSGPRGHAHRVPRIHGRSCATWAAGHEATGDHRLGGFRALYSFLRRTQDQPVSRDDIRDGSILDGPDG